MAYKRLKLTRYIAGQACKQIMASVISGSTFSDAIETRTDKYILGWKGNLVSDITAITSDGVIYNEGFFDRQYSVNHPDLYLSGYNQEVEPTASDIIDMVQFGDYSFNLTYPTAFGTSYATMMTPTVTEWYREPHDVVIYQPSAALSATSEIQHVVNKINFNITTESPDLLYGIISGNTLIAYVPNVTLSGNTVYAATGIVEGSLPFNYLFEQPLNFNMRFSPFDLAYGIISEDTIYSTSANIVYSPSANNDDDINRIYYNPFKLKNMYNYNWNTEVNLIDPTTINGMRVYLKVGKCGEQMWLTYKYYRETADPLQEYESAERVYGLYKLIPFEGHKSNIYSIRVYNSGLNDAINNITIKNKIKAIVEKSIIKAVKKIAPSNTQFWYIDWVSR